MPLLMVFLSVTASVVGVQASAAAPDDRVIKGTRWSEVAAILWVNDPSLRERTERSHPDLSSKRCCSCT
jgi:hypothetical protein